MAALQFLSIVPRVVNGDRVLLALPFGAQTRASAELGLTRWRAGLERHGWLVVVPYCEAGEGYLFDPAETRFPALLTEVRTRFGLDDLRIRLCGVCHGGRAAFRIATRMPEQFRSLTVMPGFPHRSDRLARLKSMAVNFVIGEHDPMRDKAEHAYRKLHRIGVNVHCRLMRGYGHEAFSHLDYRQLERALLRE